MKKRRIFLYRLSKATAAAALCIAGFALFSCSSDEAEPQKLSFQDIFGRDEWNVTSDYPAGYYYIDRSKDLTLEKLSGSSPLEGNAQPVEGGEPEPDSYRITLTGAEPYIGSQRMLVTLPATTPVLSFKYKSNRAVDMNITLNTLDGSVSSKLFPLEQTSEEKEYAFDLGVLIGRGNWGSVASEFVIGFEQNDGAVIEMKDIQLRLRNSAEMTIANRYYVFGPATQVDARSTYEEVTEYDTYGYHTFLISTNTAANMGANLIDFGTVDGGLTAEKHFLSFEYNVASAMANFGFQLILTPQGAGVQTMQFFPFWGSGNFVAGNLGGVNIAGNTPYAGHWGEWMPMTVDLELLNANTGTGDMNQYTINGASNKPFSEICAMGPFATQNLRLRFQCAVANVDILIRGFCFHD